MKTLVIVILFSICLKSVGGEISDYFFQQARANPKSVGTEQTALQSSRTFGEMSSTNHGITEIGIERTGCFGTCPSYTFIVKSDGSFRYEGGKYAKRVGKFTGTIPFWEFHDLAQFIRDSDYINLRNAYLINATDMSTTYTMVVMNGKKKVISNYANSGPTKLWAIEQLIDDLMSKADWKTNPKTSKK